MPATMEVAPRSLHNQENERCLRNGIWDWARHHSRFHSTGFPHYPKTEHSCENICKPKWPKMKSITQLPKFPKKSR